MPPATSHRILITNDDGIHAPGLQLLESIAREITDDVWVLAPDGERSGAGHSVSLTVPIRMRQLDHKRYQVAGTPTDCVLMALWEIMTDAPPSIVLSGINAGANLAEDMTYSGTCAAAMEGTLRRIKRGGGRTEHSRDCSPLPQPRKLLLSDLTLPRLFSALAQHPSSPAPP